MFQFWEYCRTGKEGLISERMSSGLSGARKHGKQFGRPAPICLNGRFT